jgi:hypothetical protein
MIEEPGSFSGSEISPMPGARPRANQADVVGDLEQANGEARERAVGEHERVVRRQRLELVRGFSKSRRSSAWDPTRQSQWTAAL